MGYINPLLKLPAGRALLKLPPKDRARIEAVLRELRAQADAEAENSWLRRKGLWPLIGAPSRLPPVTWRMPFRATPSRDPFTYNASPQILARFRALLSISNMSGRRRIAELVLSSLYG